MKDDQAQPGTTEANTAETCDIVDVVRNRLRTGQEIYRRDVHLLVAEIERLTERVRWCQSVLSRTEISAAIEDELANAKAGE